MSLLVYTASMNIAEQTWRDYAACTETTLDFFDLSVDNAWKVQKLCDSCDVRGECLDASIFPALESYGLWGGERPEYRRKLRRRKIDNERLHRKEASYG